MQLRLRDTEVANDDFERQARNTTSSLEDVESKYNIAIERGVILEEDIKAGEQEREALRIETQRLRDELSDLKVEAEIRQDKLRHAEAGTARRQLRKPPPLGTNISRPQSSISEDSPTTTASSPILATPPTKSVSSGNSDAPTPPSPPVSDRSNTPSTKVPATAPTKSRLSIPGSNVTPRPSHYTVRPPRHLRGPSIPVINNFSTPSVNRRTTLTRPDSRQGLQSSNGLPSSTSLTQIRGLIGKMQKLEQRVQSARSKLPAPTFTPPRVSTRPGSALSQSYIPATVTVRSQKRRAGGSNISGASSFITLSQGSSDLTPLGTQGSHSSSFGMLPPTPTRDEAHVDYGNSRPSSRASIYSRQPGHHIPNSHATSRHGSRPTSRQSMSVTDAQTSVAHYSSSTASSETRARPRSSLSGSFTSTHGHDHSGSVSRLSSYRLDDSANGGDVLTPTPSRRTTMSKEGTGIPLPGALGKKQSFAGFGAIGRRTSSGPGVGDMGPPLERRPAAKKLDGAGEIF